MDIITTVGIGIIGTLLAITVKNYRPEISVCISLATGILIFLSALSGFGDVISKTREIWENSGVDAEFFEIAIKVIATAYITQFASETAKDAGEGAIAKKLEFAGKTAALVIMMPIIGNLLNVITNTLMSF